jgi:hypothetical protein
VVVLDKYGGSAIPGHADPLQQAPVLAAAVCNPEKIMKNLSLLGCTLIKQESNSFRNQNLDS